MKRPKRLTDAGTLVTMGDLARYHERWVVPMQVRLAELEQKDLEYQGIMSRREPPSNDDIEAILDAPLHVEQEPSA